jgi:hypothetical protein
MQTRLLLLGVLLLNASTPLLHANPNTLYCVYA